MVEEGDIETQATTASGAEVTPGTGRGDARDALPAPAARPAPAAPAAAPAPATPTVPSGPLSPAPVDPGAQLAPAAPGARPAAPSGSVAPAVRPAAPSSAACPSPAAPGASKTLVIAEKRSVGRTIAAFLGCRSDHGSWIGGTDYDVTWAQGHLLRLLMPDEYDDHPEWRERGTAALPIIPPADGWRWEVSRERGADAQFQVVAGLLGSGAYARVINACDPDREGQCIADLVLQYLGCQLPVDRLWCSSLEDAALAKAFARLRPNSEYAGLFRSAVARSQADWLVGMNASRLYSASMRCAQSVGRVRTPTLALVVERDRLIASFKSKDSFRVRLDLGAGFFVTGEPGSDAAAAKKVLAAAQGAPCEIVSVERKRCREGAPTLLNTTGAQKLASERLGMSPDAVDRALQSLYEKKLATYPRTDSRFVNTEDGATLEALIGAVADEAHVGAEVAQAYRSMGHDVSKVVDDDKVEGHGALLPTRQLTAARLAALTEEEAAIARLLCASLLEATAPDRIFDRVAVKATCQGLPYAASSTTDVDRGWKRLRGKAASGSGGAGKKGASTKDGVSAAAAKGGSAGGEEAGSGEDDATATRIPADLEAPSTRPVVGGEVKKTTAKPPRRYTDATLLAAMEHADHFVDGDELKAAIKDSSSHSGGIGTPATRAGIIASLVERGYLARKGSTLSSTPEGRALVDEVAPDLKSVELTARIERDLNSVYRDNADPAPFVAGVVQMVRGIVAAQLARPLRTAPPKGAAVGTCPACGGHVLDTGNERAPFLCENTRRERIEGPDGSVSWRDCGSCAFRLHRSFMGATISAAQAKKLLGGKSVMLKGLTRADGETFDKLVELDPERGWRPRIATDQSVKVGTCPKCGGRVMDVGNERVPYLCENNHGTTSGRGAATPAAASAGGQGDAPASPTSPEGAPEPCDFRLYRDYLGKKLSKTDVKALLAGETVTLKGLVSRKTGDKFNAFVTLDPERDFRPRITGYPAEQPKKKPPKPERHPKTPGGDDQATLPGFDLL